MNRSYKGDVTPAECWSALDSDEPAFLVDVRTSAEWNFVGFPLAPAGRPQPLFAEWQTYPSMSIDGSFAPRVAEAIKAAGGSETSPVYFLCRSGARSMASASALTGLGFENCYNVLDGFEGPPDDEGHRGQIAGWKAAGLPWRQK